MVTKLAIWSSIAITGFILGWFLKPATDVPNASGALNNPISDSIVAVPELSHKPIIPAKDLNSADIDKLRLVIREELRSANNAMREVSLCEESAAATIDQRPTEPEQTVEFTDTKQFVESKIRGGVWNEEDRYLLRERLSDLSPIQSEDIMEQLIVAINNGSIKLSLEGPPF